MITLPNNHSFKYVAASGALAFDGNGWPPHETLMRWSGLLNPAAFTIITKTLTMEPVRGNLTWWAPWQSVRLIDNQSTVNAVALTNPGLRYWIDHYYPTTLKFKRDIIVSIAPEDISNAYYMAIMLRPLNIKGIEINIACPNRNYQLGAANILNLILELKESGHPIGLKLNYSDLFLLETLHCELDFVDLINSVPWSQIYEPTIYASPLNKYGYSGSVSGNLIKDLARDALSEVKQKYPLLPVISGGGVMDIDEARFRLARSADALSFGSVFIRKPWLPNKIITQLESA